MRALLLALVLLAGACAHVPLTPAGMIVAPDLPARLYCVSHDAEHACAIYRSAQPTAAQFEALAARLGVKSVIKLNLPIEGSDGEVTPNGMDLFERPILPAGPASHEQLGDALAALVIAPRPVLVHCTHGEDRTSLLVGLWRVKYEHAMSYAAWMEMLAFGFHPELVMLKSAFERETDFHP